MEEAIYLANVCKRTGLSVNDEAQGIRVLDVHIHIHLLLFTACSPAD